MIFMTAVSAAAVNVHCSDDEKDVETIVMSLRGSDASLGPRVSSAAISLLGRPYSPTTQLDSVGNLAVNLHSFDDVDFLYTVVALAKASEGLGIPVTEYERNLEAVSRRGGVDKGFTSKMLYGADWIVDNIYRGIVEERVPAGTTPSSKIKSLDYVSHHREDYKCLADSAAFENLRMIEFGFRSHKIPHLKREELGRKNFLEEVRDGDIIMFLTNDNDRDIYLTGVVVKREDGPHLIYASEKDGAVIENELTLMEMAKRHSKHTYGFRWLRLKAD